MKAVVTPTIRSITLLDEEGDREPGDTTTDGNSSESGVLDARITSFALDGCVQSQCQI